MEFVEVEIINWDRHQPRKDIKHPTWFALSNRILEDSKLFQLNSDDWKVLLYVFCQASQQNSSKALISFYHAKRVCEIPEKTMRSALDKLAYAHVTRPYVIRTRTLRDTHTHITHIHAQPTAENNFDFEGIYEGYPRKVGKQKGILSCRSQIKTKEDFDLLARAVSRYREHLKREGTAPKYIKHFSTFMASWRDWLDPDAGVAESFENVPKKTGGWDDV